MEKGADLEASVAVSSSPSRGILRRVNFNDFEAVMSINDNVYDGSDYLPIMFYVFLQSKQHALYIYEEDGKAIAFSVYYLHADDDSLVTAMAGRVRQSSQNQGYVNVMKSAPARFNKKLTNTFYSSLLKPNIQERLHQWKVFYISNCLVYKLSDRLRLRRFARLGSNASLSSSSSETLSCSFSEGIKWLDASDQLIRFIAGYSRDFIPVGPIWQTTRVNRSGLRHVFAVSNCFVTFAEPRDERRRPEQQTGAYTGDRRLIAFSFSSVLPCKMGVLLVLDFYGDDCDVLIDHIARHLRHYEAVTNDDVTIVCSLQFPLKIEDAVVERRLMDEIGPRHESDYFTVVKFAHYITPTPQPKL